MISSFVDANCLEPMVIKHVVTMESVSNTYVRHLCLTFHFPAISLRRVSIDLLHLFLCVSDRLEEYLKREFEIQDNIDRKKKDLPPNHVTVETEYEQILKIFKYPV